MPLHIDPKIRAAYASFYDFALEQVPPAVENALPSAALLAAPEAVGNAEATVTQGVALAVLPPQVLLLDGVDNAAVAQQVASAPSPACITCVLVKNSPQLTALTALSALPSLACVGVWDCPKLAELWCMQGQPLWGLALVSCKKIASLAPLADCADTLQHLFIQGRAWSTPQLQTLDPLPRLGAIVTCDLALRKARHSGTIDFHACFLQLQSLTITPNLAKYFKRGKN